MSARHNVRHIRRTLAVVGRLKHTVLPLCIQQHQAATQSPWALCPGSTAFQSPMQRLPIRLADAGRERAAAKIDIGHGTLDLEDSQLPAQSVVPTLDPELDLPRF